MVLSSMTGFARSHGASGPYAFEWELKSVNAKGLDVRLRLPPGWDELESFAKKRAAEDAHEVGPDGEARKHQDHGDEFGGDEEADGIDGHSFEGINFLGDFHGAKLGGERRAGAADDDDRGDERAKFACHGESDGAGDEADGAEAAEFVSRLERENQADEECD